MGHPAASRARRPKEPRKPSSRGAPVDMFLTTVTHVGRGAWRRQGDGRQGDEGVAPGPDARPDARAEGQARPARRSQTPDPRPQTPDRTRRPSAMHEHETRSTSPSIGVDADADPLTMPRHDSRSLMNDAGWSEQTRLASADASLSRSDPGSSVPGDNGPSHPECRHVVVWIGCLQMLLHSLLFSCLPGPRSGPSTHPADGPCSRESATAAASRVVGVAQLSSAGPPSGPIANISSSTVGAMPIHPWPSESSTSGW